LPVDEYPNKVTRGRLYTEEMTRKTYETMIKKGKKLLDQYNAVILDSRWTSPQQSLLIDKNFSNANVFWIRTTADLELRKERLKVREGEKTYSDARLEGFDKVLMDEVELSETQNERILFVDTARSVESCVTEIFEFISSP